MNRITIALALIFVVGAGVLLLTQPHTPDTIPLGFIGPLSGDGSAVGTINRAVVEIAVREINKSGGIDGTQLEVIYEDGACDAKTAMDAAVKLIETNDVVAILGGTCTTETAAFVSYAMEQQVIVLTPLSSAPTLTGSGPYFFRSYPSDAYQGVFAANYAVQEYDAKRAAVLYHNNDYGTGLASAFAQQLENVHGIEVLLEGVSQESRDYRTNLAKIRSFEPDVLFLPLFPEGAIVAVQQIRGLGIHAPILGGDGFSDPSLQETLQNTESLYFVESSVTIPEHFVEKIQAETGNSNVPVGTAQSYDNVYILAQALGKAGTDPDTLKEVLHATKYTGVSGTVSFDELGDLETTSYSVQEINR